MKRNLWFSLFRGQQQIFSNANIHEEQKPGSGEIVYWLDTWAFTDLKLKIKTYFLKKKRNHKNIVMLQLILLFMEIEESLGYFYPDTWRLQPPRFPFWLSLCFCRLHTGHRLQCHMWPNAASLSHVLFAWLSCCWGNKWSKTTSALAAYSYWLSNLDQPFLVSSKIFMTKILSYLNLEPLLPDLLHTR